MTKNNAIKSYKLANGETRYKFQIYIGVDPSTGKSKGTTRRGFKTLKEAKDAMAKLQVEVIDGEFKNQRLETYRDVYLQWVENYEHTVQDSTFLKTVRIFEKHILPAMGDYRIEKIDIITCQKFVNIWAKKLKRFRMVKNYAAKVMTYAMKNGYISKNPFSLVEIPIVKKTVNLDEEEHENFYTKEELLTFLQCLKNENNGSTPKSVLDLISLKKNTKKHLYPLMLRVRPNNRARYTDAYPFYQGFTRFTRVKYHSLIQRRKSGIY